MLFKKYFKHFRLPERSNKGQGSNPHNIFPSFFSGNKIWWRGKIIWNFLNAIWHFPYPPWHFSQLGTGFPKTGNRNLLVRQFKCNALDPTWSNPWGFRLVFPSSLLIFFRSHPGWNQFCWNPRMLGGTELVGFLGPQAPDQAAFQVLFLAPRLVHVSWNLLLWLVLRRGSSLSEKRHLLHL